MISRNKIKTFLYQSILGSAELQAWYLTNYAAVNILPYIFEAGSDLPSGQIMFPAIRYRVASEIRDRRDTWEPEVRLVTIDLFIDSRTDNTNESDELLEILRRIFTSQSGRDLGSNTDTNSYITKVGANMSVDVFEIVEISSDQRLTPDQSSPTATAIAQEKIIGGTIMSFLRFQMYVADMSI